MIKNIKNPLEEEEADVQSEENQEDGGIAEGEEIEKEYEGEPMGE